MNKVLILGGTRYLGREIAKLLNKKKFKIATLSRSNSKTINKHFICDRKDPEKLKKIFDEFKPNIIIDMVNFDKNDSKIIVNLHDENYLPMLTHYIMISTFFVYNYFNYNDFAEKKINKTYNKENVDGYTNHKIESELILYSSKLMNLSSIIRLPFIFSADDYTNRFQDICEISMREILNEFLSNFRYSLISKNDAAEAIISLLDKKPLGIIDLSNKGHVTDKQILKTLFECSPLSLDRSIKLEKDFPYKVKKNICLISKKLTINIPVSTALKKEAKEYFTKY